jgi:hypothetical protein
MNRAPEAVMSGKQPSWIEEMCKAQDLPRGIAQRQVAIKKW